MNKKGKHVFMCVYNNLDYDGRVQRSAEALSSKYNLTLMALGRREGEGKYNYKTVLYNLDRLPFPSPIKFLIFSFLFIINGLIKKPTAIHAHDYYLLFPGVIIKFLTKAQLIYDAHELMITRSTGSIREKLFYFLEKISIARPDIIISANLPRAKIMKRHYQLKVLPTVIQNIPPQKIGKNTKTSHSNKSNKTYLIYHGDINFERGIDFFIRAMSGLDKKYHLLLVGDGPDRNKIDSILKNFSIEDQVTCLGRIEQCAIKDVLLEANIGLISYPYIGLNNIYCAPNKIFEYAQAGLPIIMSTHPYLKKIESTYGIGRCISTKIPTLFFENDFKERVEDIIQNYASYSEKIFAFLKDHSWEKEEEKLILSYQSIMKEGGTL